MVYLFSIKDTACAITKIEKKINFQGVIKDSKKRRITEVAISYNLEDGFTGGNGNIPFTVEVKNNGYFKFELPDIGRPLNFNMSIQSPDEFLGTLIDYYAESGDNIEVLWKIGELNKDTVEFSGQGSGKYNLITTLQNQFWRDKKTLGEINILTFKDSLDLAYKLDCYSKLTKDFEANKVHKLEMVKYVSPIIKNLIQVEFARYYDDWAFIIELLYIKNSNFRRQISQHYLEHTNEFFYSPGIIHRMCRLYLYSLADRIKLNMLIGKQANAVNVVSYYNLLKKSFDGVITDRLLGSFTFNKFILVNLEPFSPKVMDSLIADAENSVKTSNIKQAISKVLRTKSGTKLLSSSFIDLNNDEIYTNSLEGKVVLIDVWFLGCSGCAQFHKMFENEVYPFLKKNKSFVILSVNIDKKLENWKMGIKSNLYTSDDYINVTTGNGLNHPFINYYNIKGGPYLMLIDVNGYIYSRLDPIQAVDLKYMSRLVKDAMIRRIISK